MLKQELSIQGIPAILWGNSSDKLFIVGFGDIVYFDFDGSEIKTKIAVGHTYENWIQPSYFGDVEMDVKFDGKNFTLENYTFSLDDDYK